jgi:hypothetical protein
MRVGSTGMAAGAGGGGLADVTANFQFEAAAAATLI